MTEWPAAPRLEEALDQLAAEAVVDGPGRAALATRLLERDDPATERRSDDAGKGVDLVLLDHRDEATVQPTRRGRRRAAGLVVAAAVIVAVGAGVVALFESDDGDSDRIITEPTTTEADDELPTTTVPFRPLPEARAVLGSAIELPVTGPTTAKEGGGSVWVANQTNRLHRIDPDTNEVDGTVELDYAATDMGTGDGSMWVGHAEGYVTQLDATTGAIEGSFEVGWPVDGLAYGSGSVWVTSGGTTDASRAVVRLDPATGGTTVIPGGGAWHIEEMDGDVWAFVPQAEAVNRIDVSDNSVSDIHTGPATGLDADHGSVWVAAIDRALRIDPDTDEVIAEVPAPDGYQLIGPNIGPRFVWIYGVTGCSDTPCESVVVMRVDPGTNELIEVIEVPSAAGGPTGIWIGPDAVYLAVRNVGLLPITIEGGP